MATRAAPAIKRDFAERARAFAERVPGFPLLWVAGAAAVALMVVTGGFHTGVLPPMQRLAFWSLLIGWNLVKWQLWFLWRVRRREDWMRAALLGAVVINAPLGIEIAVALRLFGTTHAPPLLGSWATALAISGVIFVVIAAVRWRVEPAAPVPPAPEGPLARAGIAPPALAAILAEDHYCRLHRRDGSSALVHARFADALADVASLEGLQTHRGAWVAADAVAGAERDGRRWRLVLECGARVPVSATHLSAVRARGLLRRSRVAFARATR